MGRAKRAKINGGNGLAARPLGPQGQWGTLLFFFLAFTFKKKKYPNCPKRPRHCEPVGHCRERRENAKRQGKKIALSELPCLGRDRASGNCSSDESSSQWEWHFIHPCQKKIEPLVLSLWTLAY